MHRGYCSILDLGTVGGDVPEYFSLGKDVGKRSGKIF